MEDRSYFTMPPKADGSPHTIREILAAVDDDFLRHYNTSHRVALAIQQLQRAVELAVNDPEQHALLLPKTHEQAEALQDAAYEAIELNVSLDEARRRFVNHIEPRKGKATPRDDWDEDSEREPARDLKALKQAVNSPLLMARKHATDVLYECERSEMDFFDRWDEDLMPEDNGRHLIAGYVQRVMMLMADNAVNTAQLKGRAA